MIRRKEIDLARGFTVFIMTGVHTVLIYGSLKVHYSWLGSILAFLAEGPGAPLFMTVMGISFTFSKNNNVSSAIKRSLKLLLFAYLLNFLKFIVPLLSGTIPKQLLIDHGISTDTRTFIELILVGDILQLAAISLVVLALVYRLKHYQLWAASLSIIIIFASPLLWGISSHNPAINYLFNLLWTNGTNVYFPVFPWLVFPLTGLVIGHWIAAKRYKKLIITGIVLVIAGSFICSINPQFHWGSFYKSGPGGLLYYTGFVMVWLYVFHLAWLYVPSNSFFKLLYWLSENITLVYLVQWTIIFWLLGVLNYRTLNITASIISMVTITAFVFGICLLIKKYLLNYHKKPIYETRNL